MSSILQGSIYIKITADVIWGKIRKGEEKRRKCKRKGRKAKQKKEEKDKWKAKG